MTSVESCDIVVDMDDNNEVIELHAKRDAAWIWFKNAQLDLFSWSVTIAENVATGQPTHPGTLESWRVSKADYDSAREHHGALCAKIRQKAKP